MLIIEHNLDVIKSADWVIDLGPEGGDQGGRVVATGTPEQVARNSQSHTGRFLARSLNGRNGNGGANHGSNQGSTHANAASSTEDATEPKAPVS